MMKLTDIITNSPLDTTPRVCCDTRLLQSGDVFVAIPCDQSLDNARTAIKMGARIVVCEHTIAQHLANDTADIVPVTNPRLVFSQLAASQYPKQPDINVAITGTNGKSSTVSFLRQLWEASGKKSACLGTLGVQTSAGIQLPDDVYSSKLTTPDALSLHRLLDALATAGVTHFAFESSSHGLDQYRAHQANVSIAGFTNLTQDHLDYHGSMEAYFSAKARLFTEVLAKTGTAVLNAASPYFTALKLLVNGRGQHLISYGIDCKADVKASRLRLLQHGIQFDLTYGSLVFPDVIVPVVGNFQIENILCAVGIAIASGLEISDIVKTLPSLQSAPGRMEFVGVKKNTNASVFVDYSHTPDALERALTALRPHVDGDGKMRVIFGCGGNRDVGKRAIMGAIAQKHADVVYITDDNPRQENPAYIRAQIMTACKSAIEIPDRREAIACAIENLGMNDVLLVAGKGHEQGQIIGDKVIPFDDKTVVSEYLLR